MSKLSKERLSQYFFLILLLLVVWLSYSILTLFLTSVLLSVILTYYFYPVYKTLLPVVRKKSIAALIMILLILLLIVPPMIYILLKLTNEAIFAIQNIRTVYGPFLQKTLYPYLDSVLFTDLITQMGTQLIGFTKSNAQSIISSISNAVLQLFTFFFVMYYCFKDGPAFFEGIQEVLPLRRKQKAIILQELKKMIHGVIHVQFSTALLQGILGGLALWVLGVPSPIFLGFVMFIFAFLPVVGTALIWIPSSVWLALQDHTYKAIGLAAFGIVVLANIDNLVRPKLLHNTTNLHPVLVFLGVLGGLKVFGFSGILLGPMVLLMLTVLIRFYKEEHT